MYTSILHSLLNQNKNSEIIINLQSEHTKLPGSVAPFVG